MHTIGFVTSLDRPARVDEFQRAGEGLLLAVKATADVDRRRGQFHLTGSISVGRSVETLAGRVGGAVLWPLSQGEQRAEHEVFLDRLATPTSWPPPSSGGSPVRDDVLAAVVQGGYPEVITRNGPEVDIIVEQRTTGRVAGIEVRASMTPRADHAPHLALLRDRLGDAFTVGVVMRLGSAVIPLGDRLWAVPVPALWTPW